MIVRYPLPGDTIPGWTTNEEEINKHLAYEDMLLERLEAGLPLSKRDKKDALRIKRERTLDALHT